MSEAVLAGKRALVTGASKGVGRGIAVELARSGADVAVNYFTDAEGAARVADEVFALGRQAITIGADVGHRQQAEAMVAEAWERLGSIDILVNNAGLTTWGPFLELTDEQWERTLRTNLTGAFVCSQAVARRWVSSEVGPPPGGHIIHIGSGSGERPFPNLSAYNASKGGLHMLTVIMAVELGPYGINVNCVAPGTIEIERTRLESPDYAATWSPLTPKRRIGTPEDVGRAVVFLCSEAADFITGQVLFVDGGLWSQIPWPYT